MKAKRLDQLDRDLSRKLEGLSFGAPVHTVYDPLVYTREVRKDFHRRFAEGPKEALFLGMNPGPWGMAQTGIPFGDVVFVRDWMGLKGKIGKPPEEHPKRPILGFDCHRREGSGSRLWGWAQARFGTAPAFFERFFVANYCPLCFLEEGGRNRTPDKLPKSERQALHELCDQALRETVAILEPERLIGVGAYADACLRRVFPDREASIGRILHPSPASPKANRGWVGYAEAELEELGIKLPGSS